MDISIEEFERTVSAAIAASPDPETYIRAGIEQGNRIIGMIDNIEEEWNKNVI